MKAEKNSSISNVLSVFLSWLRDVLPSVTALGSIIYHWLLRKINRLEKEKEALELQNKILKSNEAIDAQTKNMSSSDIVRAAIDGRLGSDKPDS